MNESIMQTLFVVYSHEFAYIVYFMLYIHMNDHTSWSVGCEVWGMRCGVWGVGCEVWGVGCRVYSILKMKVYRVAF